MNFHAVKCRYLVVSAASHLIRAVFMQAVIFHTNLSNIGQSLLEVVWKNAACSIKTLKYFLTASKAKVFLRYENS